MNHLNKNIVQVSEARVGDVVFYLRKGVEKFAAIQATYEDRFLLDTSYWATFGNHEVTFDKITKIVKCN